MKIQCCLCDAIEEIDPKSLLAKRYQNHPLKTHLCHSCNQHIKKTTLARLSKRTDTDNKITQSRECMDH